MSVKDYVNGVSTNGLQTPLQTADLLEQNADAGLQSVSGLTGGTNTELLYTLGDITRWPGWASITPIRSWRGGPL